MDRDAKYKTHPSYGQVLFHRVTGGDTKLYGSSVRCPTTIRLTICRSSVKHDLGRDWLYGTDELIEVELSPAQFAELLTTMNVGQGVPCTIRHINREPMPVVPEEDKIESEKVKDYFMSQTRKLTKEVLQGHEKIEEILKKKTINKGDRNVIQDFITRVYQELAHNMPFYVDSFHESAEKVTTQAKAEIDAFITTAIMKTGLKELEKSKAALMIETEKPRSDETVPTVTPDLEPLKKTEG